MQRDSAQRRFYDTLWPQMPTVLRTAQILCGRSRADAEDLAQEAMLKAYRSIDRFKDGTDARLAADHPAAHADRQAARREFRRGDA